MQYAILMHLRIISSYCSHEGVQDADSEGCAASEGLGEVQLGVGVIIVVVRVNELDVGVVDQLGDDGDAGAEAGAAPLQHDGLAQRTGHVVRGGI